MEKRATLLSRRQKHHEMKSSQRSLRVRVLGLWRAELLSVRLFSVLTGLTLSACLAFAPAQGQEGDPEPPVKEAASDDLADAKGRETGYPIPRFVSLKSSLVNMRRGPGVTYPIDWVYSRYGLPMEVIGEFDIWLKVRAHDGTVGWMKGSLLDGRRMALVEGGRVELYRRQEKTERGLVAIADPGVIVRLHKCGPVWCRAEVGGYKGWLTRDNLWGLYPEEAFN